MILSSADIGNGPAVPCENCKLRKQAAFVPKTEKEVEWTQKLKHGQRRLAAGQELIRNGELHAELYTLYSGWAFRHQTLADGRRQILNFFMPGDLIGFQASLLGAAEHSVEALSDIELCIFPRRRVWRIFREMPELAFQLAWLGAREEGMVDDSLTTVGQLSARERMASFILSLYRRAEHLGLVEDGSCFFPLRRDHIADALGLSLVHTIKTWSALRKAGLFEQTGDRLRLKNPRLTARLATFYDRTWRCRPIL